MHQGMLGCFGVSLRKGMARAVVFALLCSPAAAQNYAELRRDFSDLFVQSYCMPQHPNYAGPNFNCGAAINEVLSVMGTAHRMRGTCPHPLHYPRFVQMALDCGADLSQQADPIHGQARKCFQEAFSEKYNPANKHYCAEIEKENLE